MPSSRTPEGWSWHCPVCNAQFRLEPSVQFGDVACPNCGSLVQVDLNTKVCGLGEHFDSARSIQIKVLAVKSLIAVLVLLGIACLLAVERFELTAFEVIAILVASILLWGSYLPRFGSLLHLLVGKLQNR